MRTGDRLMDFGTQLERKEHTDSALTNDAVTLLLIRARACRAAYIRRRFLLTRRWRLTGTNRTAQVCAGCRCEHRRIASSTNAAAGPGVQATQILQVITSALSLHGEMLCQSHTTFWSRTLTITWLRCFGVGLRHLSN